MSKFTLLYAEDNKESRENYAFVLQKYFHKVYTAKDGKEALALYVEKKPDILLLDISMPHIDGLEVARRVREEDTEIPIIMLTAHSEVDTLLRAVSLKLETYLLKPIKTKVLQQTILDTLKQLENKKRVYFNEALYWDKEGQHLLYEKEHIRLTIKEKQLMEILSKRAGDYSLRDVLIYHVWKDEVPDVSHEKKLNKLVSRLNQKIMLETATSTVIIENSYALGYRLVVTE